MSYSIPPEAVGVLCYKANSKPPGVLGQRPMAAARVLGAPMPIHLEFHGIWRLFEVIAVYCRLLARYKVFMPL